MVTLALRQAIFCSVKIKSFHFFFKIPSSCSFPTSLYFNCKFMFDITLVLSNRFHFLSAGRKFFVCPTRVRRHIQFLSYDILSTVLTSTLSLLTINLTQCQTYSMNLFLHICVAYGWNQLVDIIQSRNVSYS